MKLSFIAGFWVLFGLYGCSSTPGTMELSVLEHYRSADSYGSVVIIASGSRAATEFIDLTENYARSRGIHIVQASEQAAAKSLIKINLDSFTATRYSDEQQIDQLTFAASDERNAQLIIDELLLLWHPPKSNSLKRGQVMDYALQPEFYRISKSMSEPLNMGLQSWHELASTTPTFSWQTFPRGSDIPIGLREEDFKNVRYHFRLTLAGNMMVMSGPFPNSVFQPRLDNELFSAVIAGNLTEPSFTIRDELPFCRRFMWTVRAEFELNGVPRQTEWSGAYWKGSKPWYNRRSLGSRVPASSYYFTVISPKNPFSETCED